LVLGGRDRGRISRPPSSWNFNKRDGRDEAVFVPVGARLSGDVASFDVVSSFTQVGDAAVEDHRADLSI
jgi:hypothetical protein